MMIFNCEEQSSVNQELVTTQRSSKMLHLNAFVNEQHLEKTFLNHTFIITF